MLVPLFTLNLGQKILPRRVTIGCYDGLHPCLTAATIGDKVLIHHPHNRKNFSLSRDGRKAGYSSSGTSPLDISLLNINQPVNAVCAGQLDPNKKCDILLVGTSTSLLAYNVQDNMELFYREPADGVNALTIGYLGSKVDVPLVIAGGNCTIQGYDYKGNDPFWTVTGDNVTSLCLSDFNGDGKQELLVGSEDYDIRVFQEDDIIAETSETEALTGLCPLQSNYFGYALANGTVGVYERLNRCWRIKVVSILGFDLDEDGVPELITGWSNGKMDARNQRTGEVIFKDNFPHSVAGIVTGDYRMDGKTELICCSTEGEVKGYLPSAVDVTHPMNLNVEQDTIRELMQKKQALLSELKNYESNVTKLSSPQNSSGPSMGLIPADTRLQTRLTAVGVVEGSDEDPHVQIEITTTNDTVIRAVMIFAEGIFQGESHVAHPSESDVCGMIRVAIRPPRNISVDLHIKVLVGYKGSRQFHVFELTRQLPRFSLYTVAAQKPPPTKTNNGFATFHVKERVHRVLLWINQNFLMTEDMELQKNGDLEADFVALRTNQPLGIYMEQQTGKVTISTGDMSLAGDVIQAMATFLDLEDVWVTADFPQEMETLKTTLDQIQEYDATRQSLMADMADNSSLVRTLVVRAEDARLLGDMKNMKQWYSELYNVNQDMLNAYKIRTNNQQQLLNCLKQLNQIIQKAGQLRVGKSKTQLINACRAALKNNDFNAIFKIVKTGVI